MNVDVNKDMIKLLRELLNDLKEDKIREGKRKRFFRDKKTHQDVLRSTIAAITLIENAIYNNFADLGMTEEEILDDESYPHNNKLAVGVIIPIVKPKVPDYYI